MSLIYTAIVASLLFLVASFSIAWIVAAFCSSDSDKGHLDPGMPRWVIAAILSLNAFIFPVLASVLDRNMEETELVNVFLINAVILSLVWNALCRKAQSTSAKQTEEDAKAE